jgi:hypothetical protein
MLMIGSNSLIHLWENLRMSMIHGFFKDLVSMQAQYHKLFNPKRGYQDGIPFYLFGGKGYPLID